MNQIRYFKEVPDQDKSQLTFQAMGLMGKQHSLWKALWAKPVSASCVTHYGDTIDARVEPTLTVE